MFKNLTLFTGTLEGEYSMWWPCAQEPRFTGSATQKLISSAYQTMSGFESWYFTLLVDEILPDQQSSSSYALPIETARFPIVLEDGAIFVISASAEKGLRLHFALPSSYEWRLEWWTRWATQCEAVAAILKKRGAPPDAEARRTWKERLVLRRSGLPPEAPLKWWNQMVQVGQTTEAVEPLLKLGTLVY